MSDSKEPKRPTEPGDKVPRTPEAQPKWLVYLLLAGIVLVIISLMRGSVSGRVKNLTWSELMTEVAAGKIKSMVVQERLYTGDTRRGQS